MVDIHCHYSCGTKRTLQSIDMGDHIQIDCPIKCPINKHIKCKLSNVVVGNNSINNVPSKCPHPGCECDKIGLCIDKQTFNKWRSWLAPRPKDSSAPAASPQNSKS